MREPTRTDLYEEFINNIRRIRGLAIECRTAARAYSDIADELTNRPSQSGVADQAVADVAEYARQKIDVALEASERYNNEANRLEQEGMR